MIKPVVHYRNSLFPLEVGNSARVYPIDHYATDRVSNKRMVTTSRVVALRDDGFETLNTIYVDVDKTSLLQQCIDSGQVDSRSINAHKEAGEI